MRMLNAVDKGTRRVLPGSAYIKLINMHWILLLPLKRQTCWGGQLMEAIDPLKFRCNAADSDAHLCVGDQVIQLFSPIGILDLGACMATQSPSAPEPETKIATLKTEPGFMNEFNRR